jgi:hypothetical protein
VRIAWDDAAEAVELGLSGRHSGTSLLQGGASGFVFAGGLAAFGLGFAECFLELLHLSLVLGLGLSFAGGVESELGFMIFRYKEKGGGGEDQDQECFHVGKARG